MNYRANGRIEWICEHGIGHTVYVPKEHKDEWAWWSHGCDGCCKKVYKRKGIKVPKK